MNPEPNPSGQPGGEPPPNPGGQPGDPPTPGGGNPGATLLTQEHVNTLLRQERERTEQRFGDYDAIKTKLTELEQASQTELERAQTKAQEASDRADQAIATRDKLVKRDAVVSAAVRAGAVDPDIVATLLVDSLTIENGEVAGDVNKIVEALLEQRPFLKANGKPAGPGSVDGGVHSRTPGGAKTPNQTMDDVLRGNR